MGQILHGSARTTEATRRAIQDSQESLKVLASRHGINHQLIRTDSDPALTPSSPPSASPPPSSFISVNES